MRAKAAAGRVRGPGSRAKTAAGELRGPGSRAKAVAGELRGPGTQGAGHKDGQEGGDGTAPEDGQEDGVGRDGTPPLSDGSPEHWDREQELVEPLAGQA